MSGENYIMVSLMISTEQPNIVRVMKWRIVRWAGHVACMGRGEAYADFWWGNLRDGDHLGDLGIDGKVIIRWVFKK
jgi:hypothetical protein